MDPFKLPAPLLLDDRMKMQFREGAEILPIYVTTYTPTEGPIDLDMLIHEDTPEGLKLMDDTPEIDVWYSTHFLAAKLSGLHADSLRRSRAPVQHRGREVGSVAQSRSHTRCHEAMSGTYSSTMLRV